MSRLILEQPRSRRNPYTPASPWAHRAGVRIDAGDLTPAYGAGAFEMGATTFDFGTDSGSLTASGHPDPDNAPVCTLVGDAPTYSAGYLTTANGLHGINSPVDQLEEFTIGLCGRRVAHGSNSRVYAGTQSVTQTSSFIIFNQVNSYLGLLAYAGGVNQLLSSANWGGIGDGDWFYVEVSFRPRGIVFYAHGMAAPVEAAYRTPLILPTDVRKIAFGASLFNAASYNHPASIARGIILPWAVGPSEIVNIVDREVARLAARADPITVTAH